MIYLKNTDLFNSFDVEVLMDGNFPIEVAAAATERVIAAVYKVSFFCHNSA